MAPPSFQPAELSPRSIPLDAIVSFWPAVPGRTAPELAGDIRANGLRRPLLAFEDDGRLRLLDGTLRLASLTELGFNTAPVLIVPGGVAREQLLAAGLAAKAERGLGEAETALIWKFLVEQEAELADGLSLHLGLKNAPKLRAWCLAAASLPPYAVEALADGRLDLELAAAISGWADQDRRALLNWFDLLSPSKQKKKQWLEMLADLGRREKIPPAQILADRRLAAALELAPARGRPAAESEARRLLWARRHPLLAELFRRRTERLKSLALPPAVRLELDPSLEDLKFSLALTFSDLREYEKLLDLLGALKAHPAFQSLLDDAEDQALAASTGEAAADG